MFRNFLLTMPIIRPLAANAHSSLSPRLIGPILDFFTNDPANELKIKIIEMIKIKANLIISNSYQSNFHIHQSQRLSNQGQHPLEES